MSQFQTEERASAAPLASADAPLDRERERASFETAELTNLLYGGPAAVERGRRLRAMIEKDPVFDRSRLPFMNHTQLYESALGRAKHFALLMRKHALDEADQQTCYAAVDAVLPFDVHRSMFVPTLATQTTPEQRDKFLPLARDFRIIGAYAQTELGHGSNVRGIETTATYLPATREFEIHSPTLTSTKWWPGGLGFTATHAIIYARLVLRGRDLGVHGFLVQLRSLDDHAPLPGVSLGDIGPKVGFNEIDNGYARFERVRIPREQMLMRFASVTEEGEYVAPAAAQAKLGYLTMVHVRAGLVKQSGSKLARALTIGVRYSAQRRQGGGEAGGGETAVLDYASQQGVLFPLLASALAMHFTGERMAAEYRALVAAVGSGGDLRRLPFVHAQLAGLKALTTYLVADGIEATRRACGGHGYLVSSGLPRMLNNYTAVCTLEGTRDVLEQQAARYFLKTAPAGGAAGGAAPAPLDAASLLDLGALEAAFEARARQVTGATAALLAGGAAWDGALLETARVSRAHCQHTLLASFRHTAEALPRGAPLHAALGGLCRLFALSTLLDHLGDFLEGGLLLAAAVPAAREHVRALLAQVRPDAVALVDAWDFSDHLLDSAIGASDGRVYERLMEAAQREPLNTTPSRERYERVLRPMLRGKL